MSDNKRYYYMRLKENFFDSDEMKILESMPDGYLYSNILLKLYLRSLKYNGRLMFNDLIPYTPPILATVTGHPVGVVEKALEIFGKLGLIEIMESGAIYMLNIQNFIGKTTTEADRQRQYDREIAAEKRRNGLPQKSVRNLGEILEKSTPEIEKEIDTDIEKEREVTSPVLPPYMMKIICHEKGASESLTAKIVEWCEYRMENYEDEFLPKRFNSIVSNVLAKVKKHGEDAVIDQIGTSIREHWKGMNLDKLDKKEGKRSGRFNQMETQDYDFEALEKVLTGGNDGQI